MGVGFVFALLFGGATYAVLACVQRHKKNKENAQADLYGTFRIVDPLREQRYTEEEREKLLHNNDPTAFVHNSPELEYIKRHPEAVDEIAADRAAKRVWKDGYQSCRLVQTSPTLGDHRICDLFLPSRLRIAEEFPNNYDLLGLFAPDDNDEYDFLEDYDGEANPIFEPRIESALEDWRLRRGRWANPSLLREYFEQVEMVAKSTGSIPLDATAITTYLWWWVCIDVWRNWSFLSTRERPSRGVFLERMARDDSQRSFLETHSSLYHCAEAEMLNNLRPNGAMWNRVKAEWLAAQS